MRDEFLFIKSITPKKLQQSNLIVGIGDDAAIYRNSDGTEQVICMDTMVEDIHFRFDTMKPYHVGFKALAVNISDLAAMGAVPLYYLVSIAIPPSWKEEQLKEIYQGMFDIAKDYQMDLIGGDTVSTKEKLVLTVTVIGEVKINRHLLRKNALPGDIIFTTGTIGDSAAGLDVLFKKPFTGSLSTYTDDEMELIQAHQMPKPQVKAGNILAESGFRIALNDISDGLASEANEIAESSEVVLHIDSNAIPYSSALEKYQDDKKLTYALFGGEDFQLIGTIERNGWDKISKCFATEQIKITKIGEVQKGKAKVNLVKEDGTLVLEKKGYNHFSR